MKDHIPVSNWYFIRGRCCWLIDSRLNMITFRIKTETKKFEAALWRHNQLLEMNTKNKIVDLKVSSKSLDDTLPVGWWIYRYVKL